MKILKELSHAITKNKTKSIRVIDHYKTPKTKLEFFFDGIKDNSINSDEEALNKLYETSSDLKKTKNNYYKLKHDLREKLLNTLFFIDSSFNIKSERENKHVIVQKLMLTYYLTSRIKAPKTTIWLLNKILKISFEYDFWEEISKVSYIFVTKINISKKRNLRTGKYYLQYIEYKKRYNAFLEIKILFLDVNDKINLNTPPKSIVEFIRVELKKLNVLPENKMSNGYLTFYTFIFLIKYDSQNDYVKFERTCEDFLIKTGHYKYLKGLKNNMILLNLLEAKMQLHKFNEFFSIHKLLISQVSKDSGYTFFSNKYLIINYCKMKNCNEGLGIFNSLYLKSQESKINKTRKEYWKIMGAWLDFILTIKDINNKTAVYQSDFKIFKLLNEVPLTTRDKKRHYITVLLAEIVHLFLLKHFNKLIDKIESVKRYKGRYFDKGTNLRVNIFIDMLYILYKNNFDPTIASMKCKKQLDYLENTILMDAKQDRLIEIVSYEEVWKELMIYLDKTTI